MATEDELVSNLEEDFDWNVENEIRLFEAMIGHKPIGINKHFHMACISEKFETLIGKPISSDVIWKHLGTMFDLPTLDKKESLPFPNEVVEFSLPESEYSTLMNEKLPIKSEPVEVRDNIKSSKELTGVKEISKKEKKVEVEEANAEIDKKDSVESETESKKGKSKDEKPAKRRGYRSLKDRKLEEETSQTPVSASKRDEEPTSASSYSKKEKKQTGKRSLRSRGDDASSKSSTPPPTKRPRRI